MAENGDAILGRALDTSSAVDGPALAKIRQARMSMVLDGPVVSAAAGRAVLLEDPSVATILVEESMDGPWLHFNPTWVNKAAEAQIKQAIDKAIRGNPAMMKVAEDALKNLSAT